MFVFLWLSLHTCVDMVGGYGYGYGYIGAGVDRAMGVKEDAGIGTSTGRSLDKVTDDGRISESAFWPSTLAGMLLSPPPARIESADFEQRTGNSCSLVGRLAVTGLRTASFVCA